MAKTKSNGPRIYIGPSNFARGLKKFKIYESLPSEFFPEGKDRTALRRLFVPVSELVEAREKVKKKGTVLYLSYAEILYKDWSDY